MDNHGDNLREAVSRLRGRLPAAAVERADRLSRINSAYVKTPRDALLTDAFDRIAENVAGSDMGPDGGGVDKRRALFVVGDSGSGKTTAIRRMLSTRPEFEPYEDRFGRLVRPSISFDAPKPLTLKLLAHIGLKEAGYELLRDRQENQMWELFKEQIRERSIFLVHIDEMQHVIRGAKNANVQTIADVLKSFVQIRDWPVHAVFSGVPALARFLEQESQLQNRCEVIVFERLRYPDHAEMMKKVLLHIVRKAAGMDADAALHENDGLVHRLIHATDGGFGTAIQFIRATVGNVLRGGGETVTVSDFADTYQSFTGCRPEANVFVASNWTGISRSHALADLIKESERTEHKQREGGQR